MIAAARSSEAREAARIAVELDPVRRMERVAEVRLAAAVMLAPRVETCEALLLGVAVPASRLEPKLVRQLQLAGDVVLDEALAFRVSARGPLS